MIFIGGIVVAAIVVIITMVIFMTKLYQRASKEQAFVRTGMGGQKVVKDGGAIVLPVFHETIPINMQTLRLTVERKAKDSLITKDRLRVDVKAEFYVRVSPDDSSIAAAAQTLGRRTMNPQQLSELIEGKFVDVLRAVAAGMDMQDLHTQRAEFVKTVKTTAAEDLKANGLELESVSLTGLDQTSVEHFNPNNAFDAEGLAKLTQVTETRRKERNDIEADNRVAIEQKNFEANKRSLEISQQDSFAKLEQEREVETRRAAQEAELAQTRAERERETQIATIAAEQATEAARVARTRAIQIAEAEAARDLELAGQDQRIKVAAKSQEESEARAAADRARAEAVKATEEVKTVEETARAERSQKVAIIAAETKAQEDAAAIRIRAEAELAAADASAKAKERLIEAEAKRYEVESEGQRALNEAANTMSPEQAALQIRLKLIEKLPEILEQMGKPIEKIDSFRVVHMNGGMGGQSSTAIDGDVVGNGSPNLPTQMTDALLNYRLQVPVVDTLAKELGLDLSQGMNGMLNSITEVMPGTDQPAPKAVTKPKTGRVKDEPLAPTDKEELQRLAGIHTDDQ
jgi:uncharacterized membrane protein YqiK